MNEKQRNQIKKENKAGFIILTFIFVLGFIVYTCISNEIKEPYPRNNEPLFNYKKEDSNDYTSWFFEGNSKPSIDLSDSAALVQSVNSILDLLKLPNVINTGIRNFKGGGYTWNNYELGDMTIHHTACDVVSSNSYDCVWKVTIKKRQFKTGDKVYETKELFVLVDTISLKEIRSFIKDEVLWKKVRNSYNTVHPYMWKYYEIDPDQFYKRSTASVGTIRNYVGKFDRYTGIKIEANFYEITLDKDLIISEIKDESNDPNYEATRITTLSRNLIYKYDPKRYFIIEYADSKDRDNVLYK